MARGLYSIVDETSEDRFDETDSLDEALRIARDLVKEALAGGAISIEHDGKVIRQFVRNGRGEVEEEPTS